MDASGDKTNGEEMKPIKRVRKYINKWSWIVTTLGWKFDVCYCDCTQDMPRDASDGAIAITYPQFSYMTAKIYFNLEKVKSENDDYLEEIIIHELTHLLVSRMHEGQEEYTVTTISRLIRQRTEGK